MSDVPDTINSSHLHHLVYFHCYATLFWAFLFPAVFGFCFLDSITGVLGRYANSGVCVFFWGGGGGVVSSASGCLLNCC